jgi:hypothetical protein
MNDIAISLTTSTSGGKELLNDVAAWFVDHDYDERAFSCARPTL